MTSTPSHHPVPPTAPANKPEHPPKVATNARRLVRRICRDLSLASSAGDAIPDHGSSLMTVCQEKGAVGLVRHSCIILVGQRKRQEMEPARLAAPAGTHLLNSMNRPYVLSQFRENPYRVTADSCENPRVPPRNALGMLFAFPHLSAQPRERGAGRARARLPVEPELQAIQWLGWGLAPSLD